MSALFNLLLRWKLRHDLRVWDEVIREEVERHAAFDRRMQCWRRERALVKSELDRANGRANRSHFLSGLRRIDTTKGTQ